MSAAALWDLLRTSRSRIDVTTMRQRLAPRHGIQVHEARTLHDRDRTLIHAIPVTALPRTLLDLAEVVSPHRLELACEVAERRRLLDMRAMTEFLERSNGRRGVTLLRAAVSLPSGAIDTRSPLERRFLEFCRKYELPRPLVNVAVAGFEVDAHWPHQHLVVELDSVEFHHTRAAFERDRIKDVALQLAGERVVRVTHLRLANDPNRLASEIAALLTAQ